MVKFVIAAASVLLLLAYYYASFQTATVRAAAQMEKQCQCATIEPCKQAIVKNVEPCVDTCKSGISKLGGDYNSLKRCIHAKDAAIQATVKCVQNSYPNACAKTGAGKMVPKREFSTLKLAFANEVTRLFRAWGVLSTMDNLVSVANGMGTCIQKCAGDRAGQCDKKQKCGLDKPIDNLVVKQIFRCALQNGFDTAAMKQVCNCLVKGGVKQLALVCPKINMNV